ncbi:MAG: rhodanese-like domain-containing protein [Gemmatimonadaceae bacterium]|nr:rhodanese-like domain-containing protein [Gemmatimonadaceae bacterium]
MAAHFRDHPVDHVIDVRTRMEFWLGHLPGAVNVPVDTLPHGLAARAPVGTGDRILVYCASGMRSAQAAAILASAGYTQVIDGGGIADAQRAFRAA